MSTLTSVAASSVIFVPPGRDLRVQISGTYVATALLEVQPKGSGPWKPLFAYSASATEDRLQVGTGRYRLNMTAYTSGTLTYTLSTVPQKLVEYRDNNGVLRYALDADGAVTGPAKMTSALLALGAEDGLTAHAGGTKAAALALDATKSSHRVSVCATNDDSVLLPPAISGEVHFLKNSGAADLRVFGAGTDTIDDVVTATGVTQAAGKGALYVCIVAGAWYRALGA